MDQDEQDSEDESQSTLSSQVEPILDRPEVFTDFLDELSRSQFTSGMDAREKLREFANDSANNTAFMGLFYVLEGSEEFYEDVVEEIGEYAIDELKEIEQNYDHLWDDFESVYYETYYGYENLISDHEVEIKHISPQTGPVITLRCYSSSALVSKQSGLPHSLLNHSSSVVGSIVSQLESFDDHESFSIEEIESIESEISHLEKHTEELKEFVEKLENQVSSSNSDTEESSQTNQGDGSEETNSNDP